jgi:hypothetical protein
MLELVQTRILSVVAWYYLAFFIIGVAMFGLTAGAVWVYLRRDRFTEGTLSQDLSYFTAAFAATTVLSLAVQMTLTPIVVRTITSIVIWAELAVCLALPFFFSGVAISLALTRSPYPIGHVYGVDLIGAATGCLGVLALLNATDGPSAMLWVAAIAAAGAVSFAGSGIGNTSSRRPPLFAILGRPGWLCIVFAVLAVANGLSVHGLRPVAVKGTFEDPGLKLFEKWNSFSRIAVFHESYHWSDRPQMWGPSPRMPWEKWSVRQRQMNIDGAAATPMYGFDGDLEAMGFLKYDVTNLAYYLPDLRSGAVIGVACWSIGKKRGLVGSLRFALTIGRAGLRGNPFRSASSNTRKGVRRSTASPPLFRR